MRQGAIAVMGLSSSTGVSHCQSRVRVCVGSLSGLSSLSDLVSSVVFGPKILLLLALTCAGVSSLSGLV